MMIQDKVTREQERLSTFQSHDIFENPPDGNFTDLTAIAAKIFRVPIAIISIDDKERIWFTSNPELEAEKIDRHQGLCASTIISDDVFLVEDAKNNPRCLTNPLVAEEFGLQFYAAAPLKNKSGYILGTFCIIDKLKRYINKEQQELLEKMAAMVMKEIEMRMQAKLLIESYQDQIRELENRIKFITN